MKRKMPQFFILTPIENQTDTPLSGSGFMDEVHKTSILCNPDANIVELVWEKIGEVEITEAYYEMERKYRKQLDKFEVSDENELSLMFNYVVNDLSRLQPISSKVSITESPSLFFKLSIKNDYSLSFEVFSNDGFLVAYSLYKNDQLVAQNIGPKDMMISEIRDEAGLNNKKTELNIETIGATQLTV